MAKKTAKSSEPKPKAKPESRPKPNPEPVPAPPKRQRPCFICDGTGQMCDVCGESEAVCHCKDEGGRFRDCEDCEGTGIAAADRE